MKNIKKIALIFIAVILLATGLCACTPVEEKINTPDLKYDTMYPQTKAEYNQTMLSYMTPYLNYLRTHIANGRNVLNGTYVVANELQAAKADFASMEEAYKKCTSIYPPNEMRQTHANILLQMQEANNSLSVYIEYLEKSDGTVSDPTLYSEIEATLGIMSAEYTSLTGVFNIY